MKVTAISLIGEINSSRYLNPGETAPGIDADVDLGVNKTPRLNTSLCQTGFNDLKLAMEPRWQLNQAFALIKLMRIAQV